MLVKLCDKAGTADKLKPSERKAMIELAGRDAVVGVDDPAAADKECVAQPLALVYSLPPLT
jgi:hypothetical protein